MGKFSREKGKRGEREVARLLSEWTGRAVTRRVRQHQGDSDVLGLGQWSVEVKYHATLAPELWWRQTLAQCDGDEWPVLIYRAPRKHHWWARSRLADIAIPSRLHVGRFEQELFVEMHLDQWLVAIGEWNPVESA